MEIGIGTIAAFQVLLVVSGNNVVDRVIVFLTKFKERIDLLSLYPTPPGYQNTTLFQFKYWYLFTLFQ